MDTSKQFAPGVAEAFAAQGADMTGVMPEAAPKVQARFLPGKARSERIPLDWPLEIDGVAYEAVTLKRLTADEVGAFMESIRAAGEDVEVRFPIYVDEQGQPIPEALFGLLDDDDLVRLNEAAEGFLPRRFRTAPAGGSTQPTGAPTAP